MSNVMKYICRNCSSKELVKVADLGNMPIAHRILNSPQDSEDIYPLSLHFCQECGLVQICYPINAETLYLDYNYCFSEWKSQDHVDDEVNTIIKQAGKTPVFEIACNDGMFLEALRKKGVDTVVGLEPNRIAGKIARERGFTVYNEMLIKPICKEAVEKFGNFKTVVARQVLEHLPDLNNFFECVNILLDKDGFLFIDIPCIDKYIEMGDITVIWEEHTNYFCESVIESILKKFGYEPVAVKRYNCSGGIIAIQAKRCEPVPPDKFRDDNFTKSINNFDNKTRGYGRLLKERLKKYRNKGFKIIIYGVGNRACTLVNGHKIKEQIDLAIDDQPEKQEKYMPGSKVRIVSPITLKENKDPILCLLAVSQENEDKVKDKLLKINKSKIEFISLLTPSDIWKELDKIK